MYLHGLGMILIILWGLGLPARRAYEGRERQRRHPPPPRPVLELSSGGGHPHAPGSGWALNLSHLNVSTLEGIPKGAWAVDRTKRVSNRVLGYFLIVKQVPFCIYISLQALVWPSRSAAGSTSSARTFPFIMCTGTWRKHALRPCAALWCVLNAH